MQNRNIFKEEERNDIQQQYHRSNTKLTRLGRNEEINHISIPHQIKPYQTMPLYAYN